MNKVVENDLIAENQRLKERNQYLEAELEYLKKRLQKTFSTETLPQASRLKNSLQM